MVFFRLFIRSRFVALLFGSLSMMWSWMIPINSSGQTFFDFADSLNVSAIPNSMHYGSGCSVYDFNQDGWDDLSFAMVGDSNVFYLNQGGSFVQVPSFLFGPGQSKHLLWVDYDNDGHLDIAFTTFEGQYKLFRNDGNFNFTDVSTDVGLLQGTERYYGITFADYDRDGDLDFYVVCYEQLGTDADFSRLNHLYRNNGDGTFTNVTNEAGVGDGIRLSFKGIWFDYDMDGWPDLFVINDRVFKNSLYRNNGDGTFTDVSEEAGIQLGGQDPMTATVGDFDNDGDLDIYMTNTNSPFKRGQLLVNNGDGTFSQMAEEYGVDVFGWTWGAVWIDYDNDTDLDLYVAHGHPNLNVAESPNFLLENFDGLFFEEVTETVMGNPDARRSYSVNRGDFNNDGYYDMAVLNRNPDDVNLWMNSGGENNYIKITLEGTASNNMAIGSWIRVYIEGNQYTQYTFCGENYIGQNSQHHIFGLGTATAVDSVEIEYVRGHKDVYYNLPANEHYYFTEGDTYHASLSPSGIHLICPGDSIVLDAGEHHQYLWNTGHQERYLTVNEPGVFWFTATNEFNVMTHSDTLAIDIAPQPFIQEGLSFPLCHGESNGTIQLTNLSGVPASEVFWSPMDSLSGDSISGLSAGTYEYLFVDTNGCSASGSVQLFEPFAISVQSFVSPESGAGDGSIFLIINGGTPPYNVFLDEEEVSTDILGLNAGLYLLEVYDANLCHYAAEIEVPTIASSSNHSPDLFQVFPNPCKAGQTIRVNLPKTQEVSELKLVNSIGQAVWNTQFTTKERSQQIVVPKVGAGSYYFVFYKTDKKWIVPLTIIP